MHTSQSTKNKKIFKILSLDGGGFRGIISAIILQEVEKQLERYCNTKGQEKVGLHDYFDLVAGTSTGSIIAAGIAIGKNSKQVIDLYKQNGEKIFTPRIRKKRKIPKIALRNPVKIAKELKNAGRRFFDNYALYEHEYKQEGLGLASVLKKELGDRKMQNIEGITLFIPAYDTLSRVTTWFTNHRNAEWRKDFQEIELWQICVCSSSAPTFFPPYYVCFSGKNQQIPHIDGGVSANNPSLSAITHLLQEENKEENEERKITLEDIAVLSIGTGIATKRFPYEDIKKWGLIEWGKHTADIFLDPGAENTEKICKQILSSVKDKRENYLRLNFRLNKPFRGKPKQEFQQGIPDILDEPYNEYLMYKYKEEYLQKYPNGNNQELRTDEWLDKEKEKKWVKEVAKKLNKELKDLKLDEAIDNPESFSNLKEATEAYITYGEIINGKITHEEKKNIREQIFQFITDNPPDFQGR